MRRRHIGDIDYSKEEDEEAGRGRSHLKASILITQLVKHFIHLWARSQRTFKGYRARQRDQKVDSCQFIGSV